MASTTEDTIMMSFLIRAQSPGRSRKSNQEEPYPLDKKHLKEFLAEHGSTIPLRNYGNRSGSLWEGNDLLQLGAVIELVPFWYLHPDSVKKAEDFMSRNPRLAMLLNALDTEELRLPDAEILKRLKQKGVSESMGVYCGLASIQRKPSPKSDYVKSWADRLRKRRKITYAESSAENTDPADSDYEYDTFDNIEDYAANIVDESEANDTAIAFIRMILTAVQENEVTTNGKPFPAVKRSPGKYHKTPTTLGTYTCWTDGSIVLKAFSKSVVWSLKVVVIAEIEVKRREKISILPQHISQLNAQMYRIALAYKQTKAAKDYKDIPEKDRTVYLICVNGKHFRVCWATYKAEWLCSLFGPFSKLADVTPTERKTRLGIQEFYVSPSLSLDTAEGREEAAQILLYITFSVVRIGHKYDEVAHYTK